MGEVTDAAVDLALNAGMEHQRQAPRQAREVVWASPSRGQVRAMLEAAAPLIAAKAVADAGFDQAQLAADIIRLRVRLDDAVQNERDTIARAILDRADKATPGVERDALLTAAAIAKGTEP